MTIPDDLWCRLAVVIEDLLGECDNTHDLDTSGNGTSCRISGTVYDQLDVAWAAILKRAQQ